jgi:hypothetical protein
MHHAMRNRCFVAALGLLATGLSACRGSGSMTTATTFNLQAGFAYLLANGQVSSVTLSGDAIVNGVSTSFTGSGTLTLSPVMADTFNGTAGVSQTETISGTVTTAGQSANYASSVTDYYSSSATPAFLGESANGEYDVAQAPFDYPTLVDGGSNGILGTLDRYTDSTMSVSRGTIQVSYSVLLPTDPMGTPQRVVDVTATIYDIQNIVVETDIIKYTLSSTGTMIFDDATVQSGTGNLSVIAL